MSINFIKSLNNPVVSRKYNTFYGVHVANPDILEFGEKYFLYFRGQGVEGCDQIGVAFCEKQKFDGLTWNFYEGNPIIKVDSNRSSFDNQYILDPASIVINGKVYLYYAGHSTDKKKGIGLAISDDGINFKKYSDSPVVPDVMSPEITFFNNKYYLFYSRLSAEGYLDIYFSTSEDGIIFDYKNEKKVFSPSNDKSAFDGFSISTVRILHLNKYCYIFYGGCNNYFDYPNAIGLARSIDMVNWERYPNNPVLTRGNPGEWDEAALWFATTILHNGKYFLFYEGVGAGLGVTTSEGNECSKICRNEDYGGYRKFSFSQIGMASYSGDLEW